MTRIAAAATAASAASIMVAAAAAGPAHESRGGTSQKPEPLRAGSLERETGLRLLVADNPPVVLEVDSGRVSRVAAIPATRRGGHAVVGVAGRAGIVVAGYRDAQLYAVRNRGAHIARLGTGSNVTPARNGEAVWVQSFVDPLHCKLRRVRLDGRVTRVRRAFPCASRSDPPGGSLGIVVRRTRVVDPVTRRTVFRARWGIVAVAGTKAVLAGPGKGFTLADVATGEEGRLRWPSALLGLDEVVAEPHGAHVALAFAEPSWPGGGQALDVWVLNARTAKLTQLPSMPARVALKRTSIAWTDDARLVLLGESAGKEVVALWRPGEKRLAVKAVRLGRHSGYSDSFAPLRE